ncbi:hypothetical protein BLNAU_4780 [Blattamonas nauphoetae]|uniref:Uncharacterized protein n=1 Tax=Blattamonas nauphoetae TaxID=2049346 RepID=A0ABQ9Y8Y9_9EUKA|nr:hypothetical protein BLNAU_4780 [Blattamonas nauphoetae]
MKITMNFTKLVKESSVVCPELLRKASADSQSFGTIDFQDFTALPNKKTSIADCNFTVETRDRKTTAFSRSDSRLSSCQCRQESVDDEAVVFRSLVATVKFQPALDNSLEAKTNKISQVCGSTESRIGSCSSQQPWTNH